MKSKRDFLVSIITPVYNAENFIEEMIKSVIQQSYTKFELILVDDCSTDSSKEIINKYKKYDNRIKYIKLDKNSGAAVARNKGLEIACGRYIAFIDSDDIWMPNKLEKQIEFMNNNKVGFSFTEYELIDEEGKELNKIMKVCSKVDYKFLLSNTMIGCSTVIIDKEIIGEFRMPLIRSRQDNATWLSILKKGNFAYGISLPLTRYRIVKNSISRNKFKAIKKQWYVYREIERLSFFIAIKYFIYYLFNASIKRL